MSWYFLIIFSFFLGCLRDYDERLYEGSISYPFVETAPLGKNGPPDKFVIRTITPGQEHVIEIPDAGKKYNIELPLGALKGDGKRLPEKLPSPVATDLELVGEMPTLTEERPEDTAFLDKALQVSEDGGPSQGPSYSLSLASIRDLYLEKKFMAALIKVNHLLSYYPSSSQLYKMKGTLHKKLNNNKLAYRAWKNASALDPSDLVLQENLKELELDLSK